MQTKGRLLIVDDDAMLADTLKDICEFQSWEVDSVFSSSEALERVKGNDYQCVISDVRMPEMNGVELLEKIKKIKQDLPVVLMTAYTTDSLVNEGMDRGAWKILFKPMDVEKLIELLDTLKKE